MSQARPLPPLSNSQIDHLCRHDKNYNGCFPQAYLARKPFHSGYQILNLDKPSGQGTHWVLLYVYPTGHSIYFDPYGEVPTQTCIDYVKPYRLETSHHDYQSLGSNDCGYYCIFIAKGLNHGRSFQHLLHLFTIQTSEVSTIKNPNDQFIEHLFRPLIHGQSAARSRT